MTLGIAIINSKASSVSSISDYVINAIEVLVFPTILVNILPRENEDRIFESTNHESSVRQRDELYFD
jgi:hypothetical protein